MDKSGARSMLSRVRAEPRRLIHRIFPTATRRDPGYRADPGVVDDPANPHAAPRQLVWESAGGQAPARRFDGSPGMMRSPTRHLLFMRHAKSSWKDASKDDHDRPLNGRGRRDAPKIARRLVELGLVPDQVISSDSERTRETWSLMAPAFPPAKPRWTQAFYMGGLDEVLIALGDLSDGVMRVLVIGHNPGWEDAVSDLVHDDVRLTTANVAVLEAELSTWADAGTAKWRLMELLQPKRL